MNSRLILFHETRDTVIPLSGVFSKAGTLPAVALIRDIAGIIENTLHWLRIADGSEAHYLLAALNSETARRAGAHLQSHGQWGARHFDKVMLSLPIPRFDSSDELHMALSEAAVHAERVASEVDLSEKTHFVTARRRIRAALDEDGISERIDGLVAELFESQAAVSS